MTARQPRRTRRRDVPAASLSRTVAPAPTAGAEAEHPARIAHHTAPVHHREHHVSRDYSYVKRDLVTLGAVAVLVLGFIVGMSFVV